MYKRQQEALTAASARPLALDEVDESDVGPLAAPDPVRGDDLDAPAARVGLAGLVAGDLLARDLGDEGAQSLAAPEIVVAGGKVEQGAQRVEVAVGGGGALATGQRLLTQSLRPVGALPQAPQHLVDADPPPDAAGGTAEDGSEQVQRRGRGGLVVGPGGAGGRRGGPTAPVPTVTRGPRPAVGGHRLDGAAAHQLEQERVDVRGVAAAPQPPAEAPQAPGLGGAQRAADQREDAGRVERISGGQGEAALGRTDQVPDARLFAQGDVCLLYTSDAADD